MRIEKISYHKTFNLGNYSNEKIGVDVLLAEGDDPQAAIAEAKKQVEKAHKFFKDLPAYEAAKKAVEDADNQLGRVVKASEEIKAAFEANYPEYIHHFVPASRQLNQAPVRDYDYGYNEDQD